MAKAKVGSERRVAELALQLGRAAYGESSAESLPFLQGSRIDYVREGLNEKFAFENPNATSQCGCGESFSVQ